MFANFVLIVLICPLLKDNGETSLKVKSHQHYHKQKSYLIIAFTDASESDAFTSKTSVPVGASSGMVLEYILKANLGTLSLTSSTLTAIVPVPVRAGLPREKTRFEMLEVTEVKILILDMPLFIYCPTLEHVTVHRAEKANLMQRTRSLLF